MEIDLFDHQETLPDEVQAILSKYSDIESYLECEMLKLELETVGYTCDYYLDGIPFGLKKIESKINDNEKDKDKKGL